MYEKTANRLKEALYRANMKPVELAEKTGISQASISQWMSGKHEPGNKSALMMSKVLGVAPEWLLGFDSPMAPDYHDEALDAVIDVSKQADIFARYMSMTKEQRDIVNALILQLTKGGG